jgi:hypothetical protein
LLNKGSALFGRIRRDNEALRLLRRYLSRLWREPLRAPELRAAAVAHVYDLVALALGANRDAAEAAKRGGLAAARRQAAKAYILAHLGRAGLTLAEVAKQQNVSPRYLRMLFDSEGETCRRRMVSPAPPSNSTLSGMTTAASPFGASTVMMRWRKFNCLFEVVTKKSARS